MGTLSLLYLFAGVVWIIFFTHQGEGGITVVLARDQGFKGVTGCWGVVGGVGVGFAFNFG